MKEVDYVGTLDSKRCVSSIVLTLLVCILPFASFAQQDQEEKLPPDVVPAPLKSLSKEEKTTLEELGNNIKKRTKTSLELMDARIQSAEKSALASDFSSALAQLAGFHAILDNTLDFLIRTDKGKSDRSFITFEIYLRKQVPRLETMRREMPYKYSYHVGRIMKAVRDARAKAVEPLFDDTVVPKATQKPK